jgi:hypothetical protein
MKVLLYIISLAIIASISYVLYNKYSEQKYLSNCTIRAEELIPIELTYDGINYQEYGFDITFSSNCDFSKKFENKYSLYRFEMYCYKGKNKIISNYNTSTKLDSMCLLYNQVWNFSKKSNENSLVLINKIGDLYFYKLRLTSPSNKFNLDIPRDTIISYIQKSKLIDYESVDCHCSGTFYLFYLFFSYSSYSNLFSIEAQHLRHPKKIHY